LAFSKPSSSARNAFEGEIKSIISSGPLASVELDCGFSLVALMTVRSAKEMELGIGKRIFASFKATAVHVVKS
jgi:molybdopterin-binding protein